MNGVGRDETRHVTGVELFASIVAKAAAMNSPEDGGVPGEDGLMRCGTCGDMRQIRRTLLEREFILPVSCSCRAEELRRQREADEAKRVLERKEIALPTAKYRAMTFEASDRPLPEAENYVRHWDYMLQNNRGLLLHGGAGVGKTYMAAAIANRLIETEIPVYMDNMAALLARMSDVFDGGRDECLSRVRRCRLMVLDDFGVENTSEAALKNVYELINARTETGMPLIVTTNLSPGVINEPSDMRYSRIYSRLKALHPVLVEGCDRRAAETRESYAEMERLLRG